MENGKKFDWNINNLKAFVESTNKDEAVKESVKVIKKQTSLLNRAPKILEAGCGNSRVVIWLTEKGFQNVSGIELNSDIVKEVKHYYPNVDIRSGDIMNLPSDLKNNDVTLSYGVVEHFRDGLQRPLKQMLSDLAKDGKAVITVPFFNLHRRWKLFKSAKTWDKKMYPFYPFMREGSFFEYRLTKKEFIKECQKAGFIIEKCIPVGMEWGALEVLNRKNKIGRLMWTEDRLNFKYTFIGKLLFNLLKLFPFYCAHMILIVGKK